MPLFSSSLITSAADSTPADPVTRSLRVDGSLSYLERATGSTDTTWTISFWAKRADQPDDGNAYMISWAVSGSSTSSTGEGLCFGGSDQGHSYPDYLGLWDGSTLNWSSGVYRDFSAWSHYMISCNSGTATVYVNNEAVISNISSIQALGTVRIGTFSDHPNFEFGGYLADIICIEGTAKADATDFIESNGYGGYKPKEYTGSFGTNGFHIDAQPLGSDADLLVTSIARNDGDTTFADVAAGHTITDTGDPEHSIKVGNPFTGDDRAIYLGGTSSDGLEIADHSDLDVGASDSMTLEMWLNTTATAQSTYRVLANKRSSSAYYRLYFSKNTESDSGKLKFGISDGSSNWAEATSNNVILGQSSQWIHVAGVLDRSSNTVKLYVDGELQTTTGDASSVGSLENSGALSIGYDAHGSLLRTFGYISDIRLTKAVVVPPAGGPSSKLSAVSGTTLLIQPEKGDSSFEDESSSDHTVSTEGSPTRTASTPYDAAAKSTAMYFDGTGDNLVVTSDSSFNEFGTGDFTIEMWVNPTDQGSGSFAQMFELWDSSSDRMYLRIERQSSQNVYKFVVNGSDSFDVESDSAPDYGSWQHLAVVRNGTSITMYVDGTAQTDSVTISSSASYSWPSRNLKIAKGNSAIGSDADYEGYIFDYRITKGTARYTSDFSSSLPSAPFELNPVYIGGDQSGNKNHFTPTNISSHDVMLDVPYPKNYATWNPLDLQETASTAPTFTEGNLSLSTNSSGYGRVHSTISLPSTGKWYAEFYSTSFDTIGVRRKVGGGWPSGSSDLASVSSSGSIINASGTSQSGLASWSSGDILGVEVNCDDNTIQFLRNGSNYGTSESFTHYAGETFFTYTDGSSGTAYSAIANFGQDPTFAGNYTGTPESSEWAHSPSNGFNSLNTSNLDDPTVTPEENFDTLIWQGDGVDDRDITGLGFDATDGALTWIKNRHNTTGPWHVWFDSVRGAGHQIATNRTDEELPSSSNTGGKVSQWNTDGFRLKEGSGDTPDISTNALNDSYVAWNWKADQTPPTTYNYSTTLTLTVTDQYGSQDYTGWGTTELEVFEGTQSLGTVGQPTGYNTSDSTVQTVWEIKTDNSDHSKIKVVWKTVDTSSDGGGSDRFNNIEVVLTDSSSNELASWYPSNYYGGGGYGPDAPEAGDVFRAQTSSADESTTGVLEVQQPTVESNSEKYNAAAGFTMFTYTGNSSTNNDTMLFNHSLGAPIDFAIGKCRDTPASGTSGGNWVVWHKDLSYDYYSLYLNQTESENDVGSNNFDSLGNSAGWFANESTGSQHHVKIRNVEIYDGNNTDTVRMVDNSKDFVFYGFAGVEGYSKFGKYTGNGSTDGPFIYTGFRPAFVLWKRTTGSANSWMIMDNKREGYNPQNDLLFPDSSTYESNVTDQDLLSNGFKLRTSAAGRNSNTDTYIYAAFAESPFKYANAR